MKRIFPVVMMLVATGCAASTPAASAPGDAPRSRAATPATDPVTALAAEPVVASQPQPSPETTAATTLPSGCTGARITFEYPPVDLDLIEYVTPLGLMTGSHVTPVDHQYYQNFKEPDLDIEVYSPAAGTIVHIQHMQETVSDGKGDTIDDYRIVIEHTCTISSIFIHVGELVPRVAAVAPPPGGHASVDLVVKAGETIGSYRRNVDYNVVDLDVTLAGLLVPAHYEREPWKIHTPDPFDYFVPEIRDVMVAKSLRSVEPFGGEFAYDIDGRLVGNWFQEGTNGYGGADPTRYWAGHLAIAYDLFDPTHVVVSMGTFDGAAAQYGVRGNSPDPRDVSVGTGVVTYELVDYDYYTNGAHWDRVSLVKDIEAANYDTHVHGVVLFQLLNNRTLQVEAFPGKTSAEVNGFTEAALTYER